MQAASNKPSAAFLFAAYLCAVGMGVLAMLLARAYQAGFSGADEPSHFLNGYFIAHYLGHQFGANPMGAATEFYVHYPKISIGHWPPAYYGFLGLLFLVLPATIPVAFAINVLVAALPALGIAAALTLLSGRRAALVGVLVYALAPLALEGQAMFMVDQPLSACLMAATAVWIAYAAQPGWAKALGFAALAALAVLIKGNGWLIALVPVFHIVLTGDWKRLLDVKLLVAAALSAAIVVPWYMLTAKIAADGFNYQAGLDYASKALAANLLALVHNLTPVGALLALFTVVMEWRERHASPQRWRLVAGILSLLLATLALQSLVPVDIVDRYMAPALPAVVVLALLGAERLARRLVTPGRPVAGPLVVGVLGAVMAVPGLLHLAEREPKADTGVARVARELGASGQPSVTVIDGAAGSEGAFIADMAIQDPALHSYVIRASKLLADSNFMGSSYILKYGDAKQVQAELRRLGVQHVVVVLARNVAAYPHSSQLRDALARSDSGFRLRERIAHKYRPGTTEVYDAVGTVVPDIAAVRDLGIPAKATNIVKLQ